MTTDEINQCAQLIKERDHIRRLQFHVSKSLEDYYIHIKGFQMKVLRFQVEQLIETRLNAIEEVLKANGVKF